MPRDVPEKAEGFPLGDLTIPRKMGRAQGLRLISFKIAR